MASKMTRGISTKRLSALINIARKNGLRRLKVGDVEFDLGPVSQSVEKKSDPLQPENERMPTEDEMLLLSTQFYDDVRSTRESASKQPKT